MGMQTPSQGPGEEHIELQCRRRGKGCHGLLYHIAIIISYVIMSRAGHVMLEAPRVCREASVCVS